MKKSALKTDLVFQFKIIFAFLKNFGPVFKFLKCCSINILKIILNNFLKLAFYLCITKNNFKKKNSKSLDRKEKYKNTYR